jgi:prepilin signal peptidase PulO-like enzyme (type II secretory pathway)
MIKWSLWIWEIILVSGVAAMGISDLRRRIIPNLVTFPLLGLGLGLAVVGMGPVPPWEAVVGALVGGGGLWAAKKWRPDGMGGGDIKMAAAIGSFLGPYGTLWMFFIGSLLGLGIGIILVSVKKMRMDQPIPLAPFYGLAAIMYLLQNFPLWV